MAFDNNQNQNSGPRVSTSLMTLWDGNNNGTQLRLAGMDTGLGISFWIPALSPDGKRSYPKENRINTILTPKNTAVLEDLIYHKMLDAYEAGKDASGAIYTNSAKTTILQLELINGEFYLYLHQNCNATTHQPGNTTSFKFDVAWINDNFNKETGEFQPIPIQAEFFMFAKLIRGYNELAQGSIAGHGVRSGQFNFNNMLMDHIRAIANAVQAQIPVYNGRGNNSYARPQQPQGAPGYQQTAPSYQTMQQVGAMTAPPQPVIGQGQNGTVPAPIMTEVGDLGDLIF